jgi:hypothetical protein
MQSEKYGKCKNNLSFSWFFLRKDKHESQKTFKERDILGFANKEQFYTLTT